MRLQGLAENSAVKLVKQTASGWLDHHALQLSAALAYYSIFSIAPLLVLSVGLAGLFFGEEAVRGQLYGQLKDLVGAKASEAIQSMVQSTSQPAKSWTATIVGLVVLLFGASGVFGQLKDALNHIWGVKAKPGLGWRSFVRERLLSFGMVLVIGFLLLVSFLLTTLLSAFNHMLERYLQMPDWIWGGVGLLISLAIVSLLFAMMFKILPDVQNQWRDVWVGAAATAILFEVGKFGLALYLGRESTASSFGAAGSVVLLLLWIYYASCILLFGAEFTRTYSLSRGAAIIPSPIAVPESEEDSHPAPIAVPEPERESLPAIFGVSSEPLVVGEPKSEGPIHYVGEHMAGSLFGAAGFGLLAGWALRAFPRESPRDPKSQIHYGLHMAAAASALILTRRGREALSKVRHAAARMRK